MNPSLDALVKNLSDDFKYLSQKFSVKLFQLVKQKCAYPGSHPYE